MSETIIYGGGTLWFMSLNDCVFCNFTFNVEVNENSIF